MKYFAVILLVFFIMPAKGQSYDADKINKKAIKLYEKAIELLQEDKLKEAIPLLKMALETDNKYADAYLSLANVYGELKEYQTAIEFFEKGKAIDTTYFLFFNLPYSINLAALGRFNDALNAINSFLSLSTLNERSRKSGEYRKRTYEFGVKYALKHPAANYIFNPINMGDSVNSPQSEYYPSLTINDSVFVFTRRDGYREDFIQCNILENGKYSKSKKIIGDINIEPKKGAINISQDGEWLIFAAYYDQGVGDFDLYISYFTPTGWSEPENLGRNVNSEFWDSSPSLSPDNRALYFSSKRPGGYGGSDLYVSYRQPNGKWGPAKNMGADINSPGDEIAPCIHADNATLYYTSDGLPGYGKSDLFLCRKGPDNQWSLPENLGYPINTIENEGSLFVASDGKTAYYASDRSDTRGELDLYSFELRPDVRPAKTLFVKGKVYDSKTGKGLPCGVELMDISNQKSTTNIQTDESGNYFITLPIGKDYTFTVKRKGYLFYSQLFPLSKNQPDNTYANDIPLQPIEINASIVLKNILFDTKSAQLHAESLIEINKLLQLLVENPTINIQINGHTDNVGSPADNLKLSTERAKAIVDYLLGKGIDMKRLKYKGYGETKPINENNTETGRALNRRTEIVITAQ